MEFPSDVLMLIREFSKPRMQCVNEFCQAKKIIGTLVPIDRLLADIKQKMFTEEAKDVSEAFTNYAYAVHLTRHSQDVLYDMPFDTTEERIQWQEYARSVAIHIERREHFHHLLRTLLYGEKDTLRDNVWYPYYECDLL